MVVSTFARVLLWVLKGGTAVLLATIVVMLLLSTGLDAAFSQMV